jgi:cell division inhibitor SepF
MEPFSPGPELSSAAWGAEMVVLHPKDFEAIREAVASLRNQATVLLNVSALPENQLQRAVDFMAGAAFALDSQQVRLGEHVLLYAPHYVQLNQE